MAALWVALIVSAVSITATHLFVLLANRHSLLPTISENAVQKQSTYAVYRYGHTFGGISFAIFSYIFFYDLLGSTALFLIAMAGIVFEIVQTYIPARSTFFVFHNVFAWLMGISIVMFQLMISQDDGAPEWYLHAVVAVTAILLIWSIVSMARYFWLQQMCFFTLTFISIGYLLMQYQ